MRLLRTGESSGERVLLIHGLMGTCLSHFGRVVASVSLRFDVLAMNLPGHGGSPFCADSYYAEALRLVCATLERVGSAHIVGISYLGGTLALRAALQAPASVRSLIVSGIALDVPLQRFKAWNEAFATLLETDQSLRCEMDRLHGDRWEAALRVVTRDMEDNYDTTARLTAGLFSRLQVPACIINGTLKHDEARSLEVLRACVPNVSAIGVPNVGHVVPWEAPERFMASANDFWARQGVGASVQVEQAVS